MYMIIGKNSAITIMSVCTKAKINLFLLNFWFYLRDNLLYYIQCKKVYFLPEKSNFWSNHPQASSPTSHVEKIFVDFLMQINWAIKKSIDTFIKSHTNTLAWIGWTRRRYSDCMTALIWKNEKKNNVSRSLICNIMYKQLDDVLKIYFSGIHQ